MKHRLIKTRLRQHFRTTSQTSNDDKPRLVVFEFNVQAVLDPDLHLERTRLLGIVGKRLHGDVQLLDQIGDPLDHRQSQEIPAVVRCIGMNVILC